MAESDAIRSKRKRMHAQGDHSECRPDRCPQAPLDPGAPLDLGDRGQEYGPVTQVALTALSAMGFPEDDPRFAVAVLTLRLAEAFDRAPTAALNAQIRQNLTWLRYEAGIDPDKVAEIRARVVLGQADTLLKHAFSTLEDAS